MPDLIRHPVFIWIPAFAGMTILGYVTAEVITLNECRIGPRGGIHGAFFLGYLADDGWVTSYPIIELLASLKTPPLEATTAATTSSLPSWSKSPMA